MAAPARRAAAGAARPRAGLAERPRLRPRAAPRVDDRRPGRADGAVADDVAEALFFRTGQETLMGGMSDEVLRRARAFLSRVAEPACDPGVGSGPRASGRSPRLTAIRAGQVDGRHLEATAARAGEMPTRAPTSRPPQRHGIRLVVPGVRRVAALRVRCAGGGRRCAGSRAYERRRTRTARRRRRADPAAGAVGHGARSTWRRVGVRSVAIVGARAATHVRRAGGPRPRATAWPGAGSRSCPAAPTASTPPRIAARWRPGGTRSSSPPAGSTAPTRPRNAALFERVAETGLLVSESPPGVGAAAAPLPDPQPADRRAGHRHGRGRGRPRARAR